MALTDFVAGQVLTAQQLDDSFAAVDWNENVIINGAMQVAQRGTSSAGITSTGYYSVDRFALGITTLGTWTQSQETDAPTGSGFRNSTKVLCTTADAAPAAGDFIFFQQSLEGQNVQQFAKGTSSAKTFNVSFWVKSNLTGTYIAELRDADNTRTVSASYTISASATWEKKTITFPADTTGVFDNDNNASLSLTFWLAAGSTYTSGTLQTTWAAQTNANRAVGQVNLGATINNYWQVTGVQLQPERASQFAFMDYGTVLAQCQRYYYRNSPSTALSPLATGLATSTTVALVVAPYPVTMRTSPTAIEQTGTAADYQIRNSSGTVACNGVPTWAVSSTNSAQVSLTVASGLVAGESLIGRNVVANGYLGWSAEL